MPPDVSIRRKTDKTTQKKVGKECLSLAVLLSERVHNDVRIRRLALVGSELLAGNKRIIDIALKYGYDSHDSFTKAFTRFHGVTPACARKDHAMLKSFAPLKVKISLEGGYLMDYRIEKKRRLPLSRTITPRAQAKTCRKASR